MRVAYEAELQAAQAAEKAREAAEGGDGEDHDRRTLPFKRRMELLVKNKAEATELWQGKNYDAALRRYTKALAHCGKFVGDLSESQAAAVKAAELGLCVAIASPFMLRVFHLVRRSSCSRRSLTTVAPPPSFSPFSLFLFFLSLLSPRYLNLAMVWEKKKEWAKVLHNTTKALELDAAHVKGLYRRAYALFQTKKFDAARDAMRALEKANGGPSTSKPIKVLKQHIERQLALQKKKQAKMAKRMFS